MGTGTILSHSEKDESWGLYATFAAKMSFAPHEQYPRGPRDNYYHFSTEHGRVLQEYQLTYISSGSGWFQSESLGRDKLIPLKEGSLFVLFPGEWHNYWPDKDTGWVEYSVGFNGSRMHELVGKEFIGKEHPVLSIKLNDTIQTLFSDFIKVAMEQYPKYQQVLAGMISNIVGYALYLDGNSTIDVDYFERTIISAKNLIKEEFMTITPPEIAERLCMSYSNFRTIFKKYTGISPSKFIMSFKILKAKELLTYTDMPVKEVATGSGIDNAEYFSTLFKRETGISPLDWRELSG